MDYAQSQRAPGKHLTGLTVIVVLHIVLGWALVNGLARKMVEVIKGPIETKIIDEVKPPPPPPPDNLPPPKVALPPPSYMPPPEVQINTPQTAPSITVQRDAPPPAPVAIAPPQPAPAPAPVRQAVPAKIDVSTCDKPEYPAAALRAEATGLTRIRFTVDAAGKVSAAEIEKASGGSREHRMLDRAAVDALSKCAFKPGTDTAGKAVGAIAIVEYVWKVD